MHSLLGYRFENLFLEKMPDSISNPAPCRVLSFQINVSDLKKERDFYTRLLEISPLVDTDKQVTLPLSPNITLTLIQSHTGTGKAKETETISPVLELDIQVDKFEKAWERAKKHYITREKSPQVNGPMKTFMVVSPSGVVLRLWH